MLTAETADRILRFDGHDLPVTSLYAHVDAGPGRGEDLHVRISSLLDQIHPIAKDSSRPREARLSVRGDVERIREALGEERWPPGSIAIFACSGHDLYEEVALPRPVSDRIVVDATPYARPMLRVLDEYRRTCVVLVDRAWAQIWELYQDELRELGKIRDPALRKPNYAAGLAEETVRNKADELTKRHYRKVVQQLDELQRARGFDLLIIGGHSYEVPAFTYFLRRELRPRLAGTFSIDPSAAPVSEIRSQAGAVLRRYEQDEESRVVQGVLERMAAGGLATAGLENCLWAGSVAAVQTLLVHDGAMTPGVVCDQSRWLALAGETCPICGSPTRRASDVVDELAEAVLSQSGSVRHVEADDRLRPYVTAAELRFEAPPRPAVAG